MSRDHVLHKVRTALGRSAGQPPAPLPEARLAVPDMDMETRLSQFASALEALGGVFHRASSPDDARSRVASLTGGRPAVASNAAFLRECGISSLPGVRSGLEDEAELRRLCAAADFGITSAGFGLADTGSLVMFSSGEEARMISLLPPVHIAVFPREKMLTGLDELFTVVPSPAEVTSSMVLITGPSRTADIEQILIRGVHGPGEFHVVVV
ncbi:MAG: lactate utilization protein [Bryobacterales bacterium]|jgi:L-lactate dehydrogenase complex protein LldG|nr:lactate utilization protein [Bryobacterales bacterium]